MGAAQEECGDDSDSVQAVYGRSPTGMRRYIWERAVAIGRYPVSGLDIIPCDIDLIGEDVGGATPALRLPAAVGIARREGFCMNHKRVYRPYRQEGLVRAAPQAQAAGRCRTERDGASTGAGGPALVDGHPCRCAEQWTQDQSSDHD